MSATNTTLLDERYERYKDHSRTTGQQPLHSDNGRSPHSREKDPSTLHVPVAVSILI